MFIKKMIFGAALCFAAASSSWAASTLLVNSFLPPGHPINTKLLKPWAKDVYKATEGRVRIHIAPQSLAAPAAQMDAVVNGVADAAYMFNGFLTSTVKLGQIAQLPFMVDSSKGSAVALWRTYDKYFREANEYKNVHLLGFVSFPGAAIYAMKKPIASVADLKGIRIYAAPGTAAKIMEAAGAGVIAEAAARSHEIISNGTVDAFTGYPVMDTVMFKTDSYVKSVVDLPGGLSGATFIFFVNKDKWAALDEKDREIITKLSGEAFAERSVVFDELDASARTKLAGNGVKFEKASPQFTADLHALGDPMVQKWLADAKAMGVDGKAAIAYYKTQQDLANGKK